MLLYLASYGRWYYGDGTSLLSLEPCQGERNRHRRTPEEPVYRPAWSPGSDLLWPHLSAELFPLFLLSLYHCPIGHPLLMGEFNSGFTAGATLGREQLFQHIRRFKNAGIYGWQLWKLDYRFDSNIPTFNLAQTINNRIKFAEPFYHLAEAISTIKP